MRTVSIAEAKDTLPALVSAAQAGETVTITRHGKPVAEIGPPRSKPRVCTPESIRWIAEQTARFPRPATDPVKVLRAMRDED